MALRKQTVAKYRDVIQNYKQGKGLQIVQWQRYTNVSTELCNSMIDYGLYSKDDQRRLVAHDVEVTEELITKILEDYDRRKTLSNMKWRKRKQKELEKHLENTNGEEQPLLLPVDSQDVQTEDPAVTTIQGWRKAIEWLKKNMDFDKICIDHLKSTGNYRIFKTVKTEVEV